MGGNFFQKVPSHKLKSTISMKPTPQTASPWRIVHSLMEDGVSGGIFPGGVLLAARGGDVLFREGHGFTDVTPGSAPVAPDTVFDLASLTKPLATVLALCLLVQDDKLDWDLPLGQAPGMDPTSPLASSGITITHLLTHSSGLPAFRPLFHRLARNPQTDPLAWAARTILHEPLAHRPGESTCYSDLGFILLGWIVATVAGCSLDRFLADRVYGPLGLEDTGFTGAGGMRFSPENVAGTGWCPWRKRRLTGEVHDRNAYALGGVAGHAGLFSTADEVLRILSVLLRTWHGEQTIFSPREIRRLFTPARITPDSTWALGCDTPSPVGSSAGPLFARNSVGHLGFTGTSFWMEPDSGLIVILLTNRTAAGPGTARMRAFRPQIHTLVHQAAQHEEFLHEQ